MTEALDIARRRFTAKVYDPAKSVTDAEWKDLLEILRLAPTSVNYQPVQYFVAETEEERAAVAAGVSDFNQERVTKASRAIVCAVPFRPSEEHLQAVDRKSVV